MIGAFEDPKSASSSHRFRGEGFWGAGGASRASNMLSIYIGWVPKPNHLLRLYYVITYLEVVL